MKSSKYILVPLLGLLLIGWGGGILSVGYLLGVSGQSNINWLGFAVAFVGMILTITSLSVIKKFVEVVEE